MTDFAARAAISVNTVKFHLRSIYAKTDTHTQAGLVAKLATALADLGGAGFAARRRGGADAQDPASGLAKAVAG